MAKRKEKAVYVVLATSVERPTAAPYVVGVYADPLMADEAKDRHAAEALAIAHVEEATYLPGPRPRPPAKTKGR